MWLILGILHTLNGGNKNIQSCNPGTERPKRDDHKFEVSQGNLVRPCFKKCGSSSVQSPKFNLQEWRGKKNRRVYALGNMLHRLLFT